MKKKQIEKVREEFERIDLSRYHILTYDELLKVNGGSGSDSGDDEESEDNDKSDGLSGAKFYIQGGADIAPMFQFGSITINTAETIDFFTKAFDF